MSAPQPAPQPPVSGSPEGQPQITVRKPRSGPAWLPVPVGVALAAIWLLFFYAVNLEEQHSWWLAETVAAMGLLTSALAAVSMHLAQQARRRSRQFQAANFLLQAQIEQRRRGEQQLTRLNRSLRALSECKQALVHAADEQQLLANICRIFVEQCGYLLAWVGYAENDEEKIVRLVASAGAAKDYMQTGMVTWADVPRGRGPTGTAIRTARPTVCNDTLTDPAFLPWRERAIERGFRSCVALPLVAGSEVRAVGCEPGAHNSELTTHNCFGALSLYAPVTWAFDLEEVGLLKNLAQDLAYGIQTLRTRAERAQAERRLYDQQYYTRSLIEASLDPLMTTDAAGVITDANQQMELLTGSVRADLIGSEFKQYCTEPMRAEEGIRRVLQEGKVRDYELTVRSRDGRQTVVAYNATVYRDWEGAVAGVFAAARDVTERQRAERDLQRYAAELARSNAELQDFASIASHDLQEPLRKVMAFGDRLQEHCGPQLDEVARDFLGRMQNAAARMSNLINALLEYSRVSSRAQPFEPVDLQQVALEVVADLETSIQEARAQVCVGILPRLVADRIQVRQLLQNLLSNAVKFHAPGVAPQVWIDSRRLENGCWEVQVRDNGIGFDEKYLERIFRPFQRLHGRGQYQGSGMGLAICRKIVSRHGGSLTATSQPGQGATFVLTLPGVAAEFAPPGVAAKFIPPN